MTLSLTWCVNVVWLLASQLLSLLYQSLVYAPAAFLPRAISVVSDVFRSNQLDTYIIISTSYDHSPICLVNVALPLFVITKKFNHRHILSYLRACFILFLCMLTNVILDVPNEKICCCWQKVFLFVYSSFFELDSIPSLVYGISCPGISGIFSFPIALMTSGARHVMLLRAYFGHHV